MSNKVTIGGGFSDSTNIETFASMIGEIYGGGEYAVPESDLLSVDANTAHSVLVFGGVIPTRPQEPHSASTVEIELRDLFQFPKKQSKPSRKVHLPTQTKTRHKTKPRRKKGGSQTEGVVKLRDVADMDIKDLLTEESPQDSKDKTILDSSIADDYAIASAIDHKGVSNKSSSDTTTDSSTDSSTDTTTDTTTDSSTDDDTKVKTKHSPHNSPQTKHSDVAASVKHPSHTIPADNILHDDELNILHAIAN